MKRLRSRKRIVRSILLTIASFLLGIGIYTFNAKNVMGNQMPMPFGYGMSVVMSGSMEDSLSVNDLIIIKKADDYRVNDIVLFQEDNIFIVHRIIAVDEDTVTTKGDANNAADEPIRKSQIKGVVISCISGIGAAVLLMKQPVSVFMILSLVFLLNELSYRREKDKDVDELEKIKSEIEQLIGEIKEQKEMGGECNIESEIEKE